MMPFDQKSGPSMALRAFPIFLLFSGCITNPLEEFGPIPLATQSVYVLNEGNYGRGNSTLTVFIPDSNIAYQDVFRVANGIGLGDSGYDLAISGTRLFIVMNGSDEIEVVRATDYKSLQTITLRPRRAPYAILLYGSKGYVTNAGSSFVTVFDLSTYAIRVDSLAVGLYPEGLTAYGGKIYVCNAGLGDGRSVAVIDPSVDRVFRVITVGDGPSSIEATPDGRLWVMCTGSFTRNTAGKIFILDPVIDVVVDSILVGGHPFTMDISADGFAYLLYADRVAKYNTRINFLVTSAFVVGAAGATLSSIAVDDSNGDVYVGDARNGVVNGEVRIYGSDGALKGRFDAGINPGRIVFRR
jgi:DNA-binding beta-propeller fold protein YncE